MEGFRPKLDAFAVPGFALTRNERDIEFARSKSRDVLVPPAVVDVDPDLRIFC
jgi:hypothetical protein